MHNVALMYFFTPSLGMVFWLAPLILVGWTQGWFAWAGFSMVQSIPAKTSNEYFLRGQERVKNPLTWQAGVDDIRTAISMEKDKFNISGAYFTLADAYMQAGNKAKVIEYLKTALSLDHQFEAEAKTDVEFHAGKGCCKN